MREPRTFYKSSCRAEDALAFSSEYRQISVIDVDHHSFVSIRRAGDIQNLTSNRQYSFHSDETLRLNLLY